MIYRKELLLLMPNMSSEEFSQFITDLDKTFQKHGIEGWILKDSPNKTEEEFTYEWR